MCIRDRLTNDRSCNVTFLLYFTYQLNVLKYRFWFSFCSALKSATASRDDESGRGWTRVWFYFTSKFEGCWAYSFWDILKTLFLCCILLDPVLNAPELLPLLDTWKVCIQNSSVTVYLMLAVYITIIWLWPCDWWGGSDNPPLLHSSSTPVKET